MTSDTKNPRYLSLLYYENPTGNVSLLLKRQTSPEPASAPWFDITSQKSQSLAAEFRNSLNDPDIGHTMYEADANTIYSAPFTSKINFTVSDVGENSAITAVLYAPRNASIVDLTYFIGPSRRGNFSGGMH